MSGLVRTPLGQAEEPEQGIPDPLGNVVVAEGGALAVAEDELLITGRLLLLLEGVVDDLGHVDDAV